MNRNVVKLAYDVHALTMLSFALGSVSEEVIADRL